MRQECRQQLPQLGSRRIAFDQQAPAAALDGAGLDGAAHAGRDGGIVAHRAELVVGGFPDGGSRGDNEKSRKIRGGQMKAEGLRDGVADIFWPVPRFPFPGLYIEMKTPTGAIRPSQREFRTFVMSQGYAHSYERSWRSAAELIKFYYAQDARFQQKEK